MSLSSVRLKWKHMQKWVRSGWWMRDTKSLYHTRLTAKRTTNKSKPHTKCHTASAWHTHTHSDNPHSNLTHSAHRTFHFIDFLTLALGKSTHTLPLTHPSLVTTFPKLSLPLIARRVGIFPINLCVTRFGAFCRSCWSVFGFANGKIFNCLKLMKMIEIREVFGTRRRTGTRDDDEEDVLDAQAAARGRFYSVRQQDDEWSSVWRE